MFVRILFTLVTFGLFFTTASQAVEKTESHKLSILTSIYAINAPKGADTDWSVLSTADGRVYKLEGSNCETNAVLKLAVSANRPVELKLNPHNPDFIESASLLEASRADAFTLLGLENERKIEREQAARENKLNPRENYRASVLDEKRDATELFNSVYSYAQGYDVEDHCYDRAHYWARTFYTEKKIKSMKVFIFFTPKYQREHDFKWWFHVAPFVYVGDSEREWVIDPTFETEVLTMKAWSMDFAEKAKRCEDGETMDDYRSNGEKEDCVLIRANMYHYQPSDLEQNPNFTEWRCSSLKSVTYGIPAPYKKGSWDEVKNFLPAECR